MEDIIKIVKFLKEYCLLIKCSSKTIKNQGEKNGEFISFFLDTLGARC